jgi:hypothetical protein
MRGAMELNNDADIAKLVFLGECWTEVMNRRVAFDVTEKSQKAALESLAKTLGVDVDDLRGFSRCLEALNKNMDDKGDLGWKLFEKQLRLLGDAATPDIDKLRRPFLDPKYRFSDEWNDDFKAEFLAVTYFFITAEGAAPFIDLAFMKISFSFGKIIERLDRDGYVHRDKPTKAGMTAWKNKTHKQEVVEECYRIETNGKKKEEIAREIREAFFKRGKKEEEVYSTKQIKRILKDEWPKIL